MKICTIVRTDLTGLGVQTRAISKLLRADRIVEIDFSPVNGNEQHQELLDGLTEDRVKIWGWINEAKFDEILDGMDILITCEIDYSVNYTLTRYARTKGVRVINVANFEFADWLQRPLLTKPTVLALHSEWRREEFEKKLAVNAPILRTPIFLEEYDEMYKENLNRSGRFLHVAGRATQDDRNGTQDLLNAIKLIPKDIDFRLVVKTQTVDIESDDPRVVIDRDSPDDNKELYRGFDAMILPRRYAGASLPMNEALAAGLPVIMTDIDPNNKILPKQWLVESKLVESFMARAEIDVFSADSAALADKIAQLSILSDKSMLEYKKEARKIAQKYFSAEAVEKEWNKVL